MKKILLSSAVVCSLFFTVNAQSTAPYWSLAGNNNATSSSKLGTTKNISLRFYTNNVQRMIINSAAGMVGIGTLSPDAQLHINSPSATNPLRVQVNGATKLFVHSGGGVSIGSNATAPDNGLHVAGNVEIGTNTTPGARLDVFATSVNTAVNAAADSGIAISGRAFEGDGVVGFSATAYGVVGTAPEGTGVKAEGQVYGVEASGDEAGVNCFSTDGVGLSASSTNSAGIEASSLNGTYAAEFNGKVYASGGFVTSDKNLKTDIHEFADAISIINKLKPENYLFKNEARYASLHLPEGRHYGLLAQDLEQVLPNLVSEASHELKAATHAVALKPTAGNKPVPIATKSKETIETIKIKAVNYVELIPIMVKAMQEQDAKILQLTTEKNKEIADLQSEINELKSLMFKSSNSVTSSAGYLKQNIPNPANNSTQITFYLANNSRNAQIKITDVKGSVLKVYKISNGENLLTIKSGEFAAGIYNYTLFADDQQIDTKQMVIVKK